MSVAIPPTDFLKHHLDPISQTIDGYGGPHLLLGLIASGGEPHIYVTGNASGNLQKEICLALADKLREMADNQDKSKKPSLVL